MPNLERLVSKEYFIENEFEVFISKLEKSKSIVLISHTSPDGDSVGSSLGFFHLLKEKGIDSTVIIPDPAPNFLAWMPGFDSLVIASVEIDKTNQLLENADLICCLDFNEPKRVGKLITEKLEKSKAFKVMVDHHQNPALFCDLTFSYINASSVCELILALAFRWGIRLISDNAQKCLYTGIVTDTGSFRFSSVKPYTHEVVSELINQGLDHAVIHQTLFDNNSLSRLQLQGFAISQKLEILEDIGVAIVSLTSEELARFNFEKGDTDGIVNQALSLKGIRMAAFFAEKDGVTKISFRSIGSETPVNIMSGDHFDGGGHANASGGIFYGNSEEAIQKFKSIIHEYVS